MSNFCAYKAVGYIYPRDFVSMMIAKYATKENLGMTIEGIKSKEGNPIPSDKVRGKIFIFRGNVLHDEGMYGAIMRQNPELLHCDRVDFETWGI